MNIIDLITNPLLQKILLGGFLVALISAIIGVYITLKKESFISDAISHGSLSGVAFGLLFGVNEFIPAVISALLMVTVIMFLRNRTRISADALIGIVFTFLFAVGIVIINLSPNYRRELDSYLFGSIATITWNDIIIAAIFAVALIYFISLNYKNLLYIVFDRESAFIKGINVNLIDYIFNILTAVAIIISIKVVGIILVTALIIIPASTAKLYSKKFSTMIPYAIVFSLVSTIIGIVLSYIVNTAPGATIVIISGIIFFVSFFINSMNQKN